MKGVKKRFGAQQVLKGFSLEVREGETVAVIGASGLGEVGGAQARRRAPEAGGGRGVGGRS